MNKPLSLEERQQLTALLAYCREMGGMDFYGSKHGRSDFAVDALPSLPQPNTEPDSLPVEQVPIMPKSNLLASPAAIDFSGPALAAEERAQALHAIRQEIGDCTRCQLAFEGRHKIVFGDGDPNAELLFVGEGPGADEDMQGLPFVGRAGQLLNNMITAMGLDRQRVYIANIVKCRPPKNRVPEPAEANTCTQFLFQQIGVVRPKLIVALGATAATYLLGSKASLSLLRGKLHECMGTKLIVTYHPAYLLRDPRQKAETWKDLQLAMKFLHLSPPRRAAN